MFSPTNNPARRKVGSEFTSPWIPTKAASNLMLGMVVSCPVAWKNRLVTTHQYTAVGHVEGGTPASGSGRTAVEGQEDIGRRERSIGVS